MSHVYDFMVVISGKDVETYKYDHLRRMGFKKSVGNWPNPQIEVSAEDKEKKRNWARRQTKVKVYRLVNANPQLNKFLTLTYAENIKDTKVTNYDFNQFIKRMMYEFTEFQYIAVPEVQERGAVHYHLLCNLRFVPAARLAKIWTHGFIKINRIDKVKNVGRYVSKYLTKDVFTERAFKRKRFFCSQDLNRPLKLFGFSASQFAGDYLSHRKPIYEGSYQSKWTGTVKCRAYELDHAIKLKDLLGN